MITNVMVMRTIETTCMCMCVCKEYYTLIVCHILAPCTLHVCAFFHKGQADMEKSCSRMLSRPLLSIQTSEKSFPSFVLIVSSLFASLPDWQADGKYVYHRCKYDIAELYSLGQS